MRLRRVVGLVFLPLLLAVGCSTAPEAGPATTSTTTVATTLPQEVPSTTAVLSNPVFTQLEETGSPDPDRSQSILLSQQETKKALEPSALACGMIAPDGTIERDPSYRANKLCYIKQLGQVEWRISEQLPPAAEGLNGYAARVWNTAIMDDPVGAMEITLKVIGGTAPSDKNVLVKGDIEVPRPNSINGFGFCC